MAKVCFESILKNVCEKFVFCRIQLSIPIHLETIVLCKERILGLNALCIDVRKEYVFIFVFIFSMVHMEQNCVMSGFVEKECFLLVRKVVLVVCVLGVCFEGVCFVVCVRLHAYGLEPSLLFQKTQTFGAFSSRKHNLRSPLLRRSQSFGVYVYHLYEQCSTRRASMFSSNIGIETYGFESHCSCLKERLRRQGQTCHFFIHASCNVLMQCIVNQFHEGVLTKEYCYVIFLFTVGAVPT